MKQILCVFLLSAFVISAKAQFQTNLNIDMEAPVVQSKEIIINAEPEIIWRILTQVDQWPTWNEKVSKTSTEEEMQLGSSFSWKTGSNKIQSKIHTFQASKVLGWTGKAFGAKAIHNWYIEPTEHGTKVKVEESMSGWIIGLMKKKMNKKLEEDMIYWLSQLKLESEK